MLRAAPTATPLRRGTGRTLQDRYAGFRPRPNTTIRFAGGGQIDTNSDGFRDEEFGDLIGPDARVVICVGESSTWGTGSSSRLTTWPKELGRLLTAMDRRIVVLNAGMPGYTTVENLQLLSLRLLKYRPEAVIYMGFRNDVVFYATSLGNEADLNFYPRPLGGLPSGPLTNFMMRSSLAGRLVTMAGNRLGLDRQGVPIPRAGAHLTARGVQTLGDQIALMAALARRHSVRLLWVDQPLNRSAVADLEPLEEGRDVLRMTLEKQAIPLLRADTEYRHREFPMLDDVHFSDAGNRHLAAILAPQVVTQINVMRDERGAGVRR